MTPERWLDTKAMILDRFGVTAQGQERLEDGPGTVEWLEFTTPAGAMRFEYELRPRITGKHAVGGHKVGVGARVAYEYSPDEHVGHLTVLKNAHGLWQEVDDPSALLS